MQIRIKESLLIDSIETGHYLNQLQVGFESTLSAVLGREATDYTIRQELVTWEEIYSSSAKIDPQLDLKQFDRKNNKTMTLNKILFTSILILVFPHLIKAENKETYQNQNIDKQKSDVTFGLIIGGNNPEKEFKEIKELGFSHCQLNVAEYTPELAKLIRSSSKNIKYLQLL